MEESVCIQTFDNAYIEASNQGEEMTFEVPDFYSESLTDYETELSSSPDQHRHSDILEVKDSISPCQPPSTKSTVDENNDSYVPIFEQKTCKDTHDNISDSESGNSSIPQSAHPMTNTSLSPHENLTVFVENFTSNLATSTSSNSTQIGSLHSRTSSSPSSSHEEHSCTPTQRQQTTQTYTSTSSSRQSAKGKKSVKSEMPSGKMYKSRKRRQPLHPSDQDQDDDSRLLPPCRVCHQKASGFHYGANTCEGCKVSSIVCLLCTIYPRSVTFMYYILKIT